MYLYVYACTYSAPDCVIGVQHCSNSSARLIKSSNCGLLLLQMMPNLLAAPKLAKIHRFCDDVLFGLHCVICLKIAQR